MSRLLRYIILVSLLLTPGILQPAPARADDCQQLLPHGVYEGTTSAVMTIRAYGEGMLLQEFTFNDTGELTLTLDCTVTAGSYTWHIHRTTKFFPEQEPIPCDYTTELSQPSGTVVVGANGQPRIDVTWAQGVTGPNDCVDSLPIPSTTWQFSLDGPEQDRTIGGDFRYTGQDLSDYEDIAAIFRDQGFEVTLTKSWTLARAPQPTVQNFSATLRQFFLAGIPVTNRYTAAIDWEGGGPGVARFLLGDQPPRLMTVNGNSASIDLPLASIAGTGDFPISVEAELDGRIDRLDGLGPLTLVPVPAWANRFNLQPQVQGNHVRYSGGFALPEEPLDAHVVLPAAIPYVGGVWGLLPTQLKLVLAASSLGTRETGGLSAQGGFGLGKRTFMLSAGGNIYGTITHDVLKFESDPLTLSTPPIAFREHLGLVSVIPGASSLFGLPVIGDLFETLDSALGVSAEIHGSMSGRGRLGVTGETLGLTEGSYDAKLGVQASGGLDTPFLWATITGGGDGSLAMQIIPATKLISCHILLSFQARAGALGFSAVNVQSSWPLYTCTVGSGQRFVVTAGDVTPRLVYGMPGAHTVEQQVMQVQTTNGLTETVLVENAGLQARPVLVTGANGQMALVWNSVSSSGAADAVSLRLFDGAAWGDTLTVSRPDHPAFTPSAVFTGDGNLLIAWAEAQSEPDPGGLTEAFARSLEIAWAEVIPATGAIARRGLATTDTILDFAPRLSAAADGSVWLLWQHSPGTNLAGLATAPNHWQAAAWDGDGWTAAETAAQNGVGTLFWDMAAADGEQVWLVADVDVDGDLGTADDREIYLYERSSGGWSAPRRLTDNDVLDGGPLVAVTSGGKPVIAWRQGQRVLGLDGDPGAAPQVWLDDGSVGPLFGAGRLLVGAGGNLALLWPGSTEQGQDIWLASFNPESESWNTPAPIFASAEQRRALSAALLPDGGIVLGLAATPVISETVSFEGGGATEVPTVGDEARLLVARIPAEFGPGDGETSLFMPAVQR